VRLKVSLSHLARVIPTNIMVEDIINKINSTLTSLIHLLYICYYNSDVLTVGINLTILAVERKDIY
jgi:hypothetical protein